MTMFILIRDVDNLVTLRHIMVTACSELGDKVRHRCSTVFHNTGGERYSILVAKFRCWYSQRNDLEVDLSHLWRPIVGEKRAEGMLDVRFGRLAMQKFI